MRTSENYVCTLSTFSVIDMEKLDTIRNSVKCINKNSNEKHRVVVKGRKAIKKINGRSYNHFGDIVGGLANAKYYDVYIYKA